MSNNFTCSRCLKAFSTAQRLATHMERKFPCESIQITAKNLIHESRNHVCQHCGACFTQKSSLNRHQKDRCSVLKKDIVLEEKLTLLEKQFIEMKEKQVIEKQVIEKQIGEVMTEIKGKSSTQITNQILVCVGSNDNYLDMLTEQYGSFDRALEFIKGCALSNLRGDCKLIEKIYCSNDHLSQSIYYIDKAKTRIQYYNENKEKIIDSKELFCRKLANNLQNSYLKGVNYLIRRNLDNNLCPNKFLDEYDIQTWNQHIYELSDIKYQKKILNQLDIPFK